MNKDLHNIDDLFKQAIEGQQEIPPANVWDKIDNELDKNKVVSIQKKYNYLKRVAIALFIFCFMASVYALYLHNSKDTGKIVTTNKNVIPTIKDNSSEDQTLEDQASEVKTSEDKTLNITSTDSAINNISSEDKLPNRKSNLKSVINTEANSTVLKNVTAKKSANQEKIKFPETIQRTDKSTKENLLKEIIGTKDQSIALKRTAIKNGILKGSKSSSDKIKSLKEEIKQKTISSNNSLVTHQIKSENLSEHSNKQIPEEQASLKITNISNDPLLKNILVHSNGMYFSAIARSNIAPNFLFSPNVLSKNPFTYSKFALTAFFSPETATNHLKDDNQQMRGGTRNDFKEKEKSSSFNTGLLIDYSLNTKWNLQSGIIFSSSTATLSPKTIFAQPDNRGHVSYELRCSAGYSYVSTKTGNSPTVGDSAKAISSKSSLQYIAVPVTVNYLFSFGKFNLRPGAGIAVNFLTKGKVETTLSSNYGNERITNNAIQGLKSNYLNGIASISAEFSLSKNLSVNLTPTSRFALTSINTNTPVKTYPRYFGLGAGVRVSF